jgi:hypothetical protein
MHRRSTIAFVAAAAALASVAQAQTPPMKGMDHMAGMAHPARAAKAAKKAAAAPAEDYARDQITAVANLRHAIPPSANCVVWANAEGLGVGPDQLGGLHGVSMIINPAPLPEEPAAKPVTFADGLASLKTQYPQAPAWFFAAIEKTRAAVEAACAKDVADPIKITALTKRDVKG